MDTTTAAQQPDTAVSEKRVLGAVVFGIVAFVGLFIFWTELLSRASFGIDAKAGCVISSIFIFVAIVGLAFTYAFRPVRSKSSR